MYQEPLSMWMVYRHPLDFPNQYVARRWLVTVEPIPTDDLLIADDLESLRGKLPVGLLPLAPSPGDDPNIVETWL